MYKSKDVSIAKHCKSHFETNNAGANDISIKNKYFCIQMVFQT